MANANSFCEARVHTSGSFLRSNCSNRAKAQYNGKWLCGVHSPEAEAKRKTKREERDVAHSASIDRRIAREKHRDACTAAFHDSKRTIATEHISEGLFWRLYDFALILKASPPDYAVGEIVGELLRSLKIEVPPNDR